MQLQSATQLLLSPLSLSLFIVLGLLLLVTYIWRNSSDKRVPPGSLGWPYIGETLKLYFQNPKNFFSKRQKGYGDIFKTHILGCPCVMVSTPELAKIVLVSSAHLFKPAYPHSKEMMIGPEALFFHQGDYHSMLRKLIQTPFLPASLRESVSVIEKIVLRILPSWRDNTINTLKEMKEFAFEVAMHIGFGGTSEIETIGMKHLYHCLEKGYNSMPLNLPGTPFWKAIRARKLLNETLKKVIQSRRRIGTHGGGLLGVLLASKELHNNLTDSQVADNMIGVIFAAHDTTASVLTWLFKYLHDNKQVLMQVKDEQDKIRITLESEQRGLTWDDTRKMTLTSRVILETLRSASILSFTFREAVQDVELKGYLIPKGWKVLPLFRNIHHCEEFFPSPEKFDPSRFEVPQRPNTFMPFGNGVHTCPGNELAKLEMLILLHHVTTMYRWKVARKDEGVKYKPFPVPKRGLPLTITSRDGEIIDP